jgi:hydroxyethylthiazole kinase-like uncharacterized protein yjeF
MNSQPATLDTLKQIQLLKRDPAEHKGNAGKVVLIGGAPGMAGALILAGNACLHLGAGWTILEMLDPASVRADANQPELMIRLATVDIQKSLSAAKPDVIAIGPGLGKSELASCCLHAVLAYPSIPLVIDADALNLIGESPELLKQLQTRNKQFPGSTVLTLHPGEAAKLLQSTTQKVQSDRVNTIQQLIKLTQSIVVLKGQHTLIAAPEHPPTKCMAGNPGMGTGGMGDVLTGSIAAIAGQGVRHQINLLQATGSRLSSMLALQIASLKKGLVRLALPLPRLF